MVFESYPNIASLNRLYIKHKINIQVSKEAILCERLDYREINITIDNKSFVFFVDDEYQDFRFNYPLLNLCIVLRELEDYKYAEDYLNWCKERQLNASDMELRDYFTKLGTIYSEIESIIGEINSFVPDMDFEFNMREARVLRKQSY